MLLQLSQQAVRWARLKETRSLAQIHTVVRRCCPAREEQGPRRASWGLRERPRLRAQGRLCPRGPGIALSPQLCWQARQVHCRPCPAPSPSPDTPTLFPFPWSPGPFHLPEDHLDLALFPPSPSKRDIELLLKLIANLNMLLRDENVNVVKRAILTMTQLYKVALQVSVPPRHVSCTDASVRVQNQGQKKSFMSQMHC